MKVSHEKAREIAQRYINYAFGNSGELPRHSIPARPDHDDDLLLMAYIEQQAGKLNVVSSKDHVSSGQVFVPLSPDPMQPWRKP